MAWCMRVCGACSGTAYLEIDALDGVEQVLDHLVVDLHVAHADFKSTVGVVCATLKDFIDGKLSNAYNQCILENVCM